MESFYKTSKQLFIYLLSLGVLGGCLFIGSQERSEEALSDPDVPLTSQPPATAILEEKWQHFLEALRLSIVNESEENIIKLQASAKSLNETRNLSLELKNYLSAIVNYKQQSGQISQESLSQKLLTTGLGVKDLAISQDSELVLQDEAERQKAADQVIDVLTQKYHPLTAKNSLPQTPTTSLPPSDSTTSSPPTPESTPSESNESPKSISWLPIVLLMLPIALLWKFRLFRRLLKFLKPRRPRTQHSETNVDLAERVPEGATQRLNQFPAQNLNYIYTDLLSRIEENEKKTNQEIHKLYHQNHELRQAIDHLERQINSLESDNNPRRGKGQAQTSAQNTAELVGSSTTHNTNPSQSLQKISYKEIIAQSIPVKDVNLMERRQGFGEHPFFTSTNGKRSDLGIYPIDQSGQYYYLLPTKARTSYENLNSYFQLNGSIDEGEVEVLEPAYVITSGQQTWRLYRMGIIQFSG